MLIPIGTDVRTRRPPTANWLLIGLNVVIFLFTDWLSVGLGQFLKNELMLDGARPLLHQYVTYQFLHGDLMHLLGNMLFLWIFGGAVCDRMGSLCYTLFYLAGGVFSGIVFTTVAENPILGASGAIAAVTTAFLVLFPRVHVTMLLFFFLITTFQIPAMLLIVFKVILWDNLIAPRFDHGITSSVAYSAHLGGYAFGFLVAMSMLVLRALPRNQFDILALWTRWRRRNMPGGIASIEDPSRAQAVTVEELGSRPLQTPEQTPAEKLRSDIIEHVANRDVAEAARLYLRLIEMDADQVLPRHQQLEVGNQLARAQRHDEAVGAYEKFLSAYPTAADIYQVRLLAGLICNRYLREFSKAADHLRVALKGLTLDSQRSLALEELRQAESSLPDST